jgi:hypothetical protein
VDSRPRDFVRQGLDFDGGDFVAADLSQGMLIDTRELSKLLVKGKPNSTICRTMEDNPDGYANPFFVDQDLTIYMFEVDFKKPGTSRTLAKCQFTPARMGSPHLHSFVRE